MWPAFNYCEVWRGSFSPEECRAIIAMRRGDGASGHLPLVRECRLFWIHCTDATRWLFDRLGQLVLDWNACYRFELAERQESALQLSRYEPGQRYDWHMDLGHGPMSLRKATLVVELAGAEAGGGLEIFYGERDGALRLLPGDVAIFPSFIMHRAAPVVRGERWSLAAWITGTQSLR